MPKGHRQARSQGYYRLSPVVAPTTQYSSLSRQSMPAYYPTTSPPLTMSSQNYSQQQQQQQHTYSQGGPVQHPMNNPPPPPNYNLPPTAPVSLRPSSGAWNPTDDQTLMQARAQGMNWQPIQQAYFPTKTPNACRKRHERLMERRNADDWDGLKLENLAKNYMNMRREIWSGLAAQTGEKWNVVEQKCMSQGLKNLQTSARSCARRERLLDSSLPSHSLPSHPSNTYPFDPHTDDSGYADDLEAEYDGDNTSERSGGSYQGVGGGGHSYSQSAGSAGSFGMGMQGGYGGQQGQGGRLPSMDMGIDAIINRPGGGR